MHVYTYTMECTHTTHTHAYTHHTLTHTHTLTYSHTHIIGVSTILVHLMIRFKVRFMPESIAFLLIGKSQIETIGPSGIITGHLFSCRLLCGIYSVDCKEGQSKNGATGTYIYSSTCIYIPALPPPPSLSLFL